MALTSKCGNFKLVRSLFDSLKIAAINPVTSANKTTRKVTPIIFQNASLHNSPPRLDLMEFFDEKKNWGVTEVKVGRSWRKEELRIKSNTDLHKLWFVLLKERNMLMTMEHECNDKVQMFPNPERLDKVKESMDNLEEVVRERNRAYFELETGETGERPSKVVNSALGLRFKYKMREYPIPKFMNQRWKATHHFGFRGHAVHKFLKLYREKLFLTKKKSSNRNRNHVLGLLKRFPHLDDQTLQANYPDVDLKKIRSNKELGVHPVSSA